MVNVLTDSDMITILWPICYVICSYLIVFHHSEINDVFGVIVTSAIASLWLSVALYGFIVLFVALIGIMVVLASIIEMWRILALLLLISSPVMLMGIKGYREKNNKNTES